MSAVIARDAIAPALKHAVRLVPDRTTIPVLNCVRLNIGPSRSIATACDLNSWFTATLDAEAKGEWSGCVDAQALHAFTASLPAGSEITLTGDDAQLAVTGPGARACFRVLPADEFPLMRDAVDALSFEIEADALAAACKFVEPTASEDGARYYLCGANIDPAGLLVSTDGNRLATCRLAVELPAIPGDIIVPRPILKLLPNLLRGFAEPITVGLAPRAIIFDAGGWNLASKLIGGTYPDWRRVTPPRVAEPMIAEVAALRRAIARVNAVYRESQTTRAVRLRRAGDALTIAAVTDGSDPAEIISTIPVRGGGDIDEIGLSAKFLAEALAVIDAGDVEIHVTDRRQPIRLFGAGESETGVLIVPMRV
jgi:DNA polymerase III subunit beta